MESDTQKIPGELVEISEGEVVVALQGGLLAIGKTRDAAGAKTSAGEFARNNGLQAGMKFGCSCMALRMCGTASRCLPINDSTVPTPRWAAWSRRAPGPWDV